MASLRLRTLLVPIALMVATAPAIAQAPPDANDAPEGGALELHWVAGPASADIGDGLAEIDLPEGYLFLGADDTRALMEAMQNPVDGSEQATIAPAGEDEDWFLVFEWSPIGWVDDSEREDLDADALLASLKEGTEQSNELRRQRGWPTLEIVGWREPPHYDEVTNNLTWAIEAQSEGQPVVNRLVKLLGRRGVMSVTLVADPAELSAAAIEADALLGGYRFQQGNTYAEFVPGTDTMAKVGLGALIAGGAGAALVKSGLLARFWKLIVAGVVAAGTVVSRIFRGPKRLAEPPSTEV